MYVALILSQRRIGECFKYTPRSVSKYCIHATSEVAIYIALYSASVDDFDTVGCFLLDHEMRFVTRKTQLPDVEVESSGVPPQSASEYANNVGAAVLERNKPTERTFKIT